MRVHEPAMDAATPCASWPCSSIARVPSLWSTTSPEVIEMALAAPGGGEHANGADTSAELPETAMGEQNQAERL